MERIAGVLVDLCDAFPNIADVVAYFYVGVEESICDRVL